MTWAQRLKRVFNIDIETCEACGGRVKVIACIEDPAIIMFGAFFGEEQTASPAKGQTIGVGDTFRTNKFEIQIDQVSVLSLVGLLDILPIQAPDGATYVAVAWSYKNISDKPINGVLLPDLHLKSPDGIRYNPDIAASFAFANDLQIDTKMISDLNPGIRVRDSRVFEVNKEMLASGDWRLLIDADQNAEVAIK